MYVCLCHGITDANVREAARRGAASARDVFERHGVKPECGTCAYHVSGLIEEQASSAARRD
ncbi:MAG: (2Fe-2S)-binding protein [Alphaproteobacteria bacterium]